MLEAIKQSKDLEVFGLKKKDAPKWLTPEHVVKCLENSQSLERWKPKVGDWYFCHDLCRIMEIKTLSSYFTDPGTGSPGVLASDSHVTKGRWPCDNYIPNPTKLKNILGRKKTMMGAHFVSASCGGEKCFCKEPAMHKIEEAIMWDDPNKMRHPFTAYVCCKHFRMILGPAVPCKEEE